MSDDEIYDPPLKVTLKGDGAAPWITVDGFNAGEVEGKLNEIRNSGLLQSVAETNALFTGAVQVTNGFGAPAQTTPAVGGPPSPGPQQGAQAGAPSYPQYQQPAQLPPPGYQPPAQTQQVASFNGAPHPEGMHCSKCGAGVIGKETRTGKRLWTCPNQRSKGDGHYTKWLDD